MLKGKLKDKEVVIIDTGEVTTIEQLAFEYIKETYPEEEEKRKKKRDYLEKKKSDNNFYISLNNLCGTFYFLNYSSLLEKQYLFRFIYLCSHMNYDNIIIYKDVKCKSHKTARKKDLQEILKLKDGQFYPTLKYFIENELVIVSENEEEVRINEKVCKRGKIMEKINTIRMFDNGVRELYEKATTREHNKLDLFIKMLPYLNTASNILCHNPEEPIAENLKPISLNELTKILGYSSRQNLKNYLIDTKIKEQTLFGVTVINKMNFIVINPLLYYKGNNIEDLTWLINLFKLIDKNN